MSTSGVSSAYDAWLNQTSTGGSIYPSGFDHALDDNIDALATGISAEIAQKPHADLNEYGAVIWKEQNGTLHRTSIAEGTPNNVDFTNIFAEIDFAHGGEVVALIHSHPAYYMDGSSMFAASPDQAKPSYADFGVLLDAAAGTGSYSSGYDNVNFRSYIVFNGNTSEYYAFDQPANYRPSSAQAIYAVESTDY